MTQFPGAPSGATALEDPNSAPIGGGVPQTSQGQQFLLEEQAAYTGRGQQLDLGGTLIPPEFAGDFWAFYQMAEQFAANTGWKYLLTPAQLIDGIRNGVNQQDTYSMFRWMAQKAGVDIWSMPWAYTGLSHQQYTQQMDNLRDSLFSLTGTTSWGDAGVPQDVAMTAVTNGWSSAQLSDYIQRTMPGRFGYLKYGYTYSTFQAYKTQNADTLRSRYGSTYTDAQAVENIGSPLSQFHAQGGAFGQATPYVKSDQTIPTGFQSGAR